MNFKLLNSPPPDPDKNTPFSEVAVMLMNCMLEIKPAFELASLGQVVK